MAEGRECHALVKAILVEGLSCSVVYGGCLMTFFLMIHF